MGSVELRQLEYFVAVAEHLHFGRAAEALSIGQPAVSQQVARLERTLGTSLLDRTPRTVRLTGPGLRFLPRARAVLAAVELAREAVADPGAPGRPLRLGTCSGLGRRLDDVLAALDQAVELTSIPTRARLERVAAGQLDAAFVRGPVAALSRGPDAALSRGPDAALNRGPDAALSRGPDAAFVGVAGVELIEVWRDRLVAVLPAGHPLAHRPAAPIGELAALPLRMVARRANPALVDLVLGCCADAGHTPRRLEYDDGPVDTLLAAIAAGPPSWTVLYESHARMLNSPRVAFVPVEPDLRLPTFLAVRENGSSRAIAPILDACAITIADRC